MKYQVKMKTIDGTITPQNKLILCKARDIDSDELEQEKIRQAHEKLARAYQRAHCNVKKRVPRIYEKLKSSVCMKSLGVGIVTGAILSFALSRRRGL